MTQAAGKIDLLSCHAKTSSLKILELKTEDSRETMVRCVLEGRPKLEALIRATGCTPHYIAEG